MKAAKKQTKPKSGKEQTGENDSIARIPTFFKPVAKKFAINENGPKEKSDNSDKSFYVGVLKEKLRRNRFGEVARVEEEEKNSDDVPGPAGPQCESGSVSLFNCSECVQKDIVISEWKQKYKDSMKLYNKQSVHFSELYSKYKDLLKTVECINKPATEAAESSDIFTANEVKYLQCMDLAKNNDCTFVHHCLKFAYKQDLSVMVSRTLWGTASSTQTSKNGTQIQRPAKDPLTPEKVRRIKALFAGRISKCTIDSADYAERMKDTYVNKLLAAGIKNLAQKFKEG